MWSEPAETRRNPQFSGRLIPAPVLVENTIRLGRHTILAKVASNGSLWEPELPDDQMLAALLTAAYGREIAAADAPVRAITFAVRCLLKGDRAGAADALNAIRLDGVDEAGADRLSKADALIAAGVSPRAALAKLLPGLAKYSPDQPRVPAGSSDGGQWTDGSEGAEPDLEGATSTTDTAAVATRTDSESSGRIQVADDSDPSVATDGSTSNTPPIPDYKSKIVSQDDWRAFNNAMAVSGRTGDVQAFAYGQTFAAEGGMTPNPDNGRVAGFDQAAITRAIDAKDLPAGTTLDTLTAAQAATLYRRQTDANFKTVGGVKALDAVGDKHAAAALADTLFWQGSGSGAQTVQQAINSAISKTNSQIAPVAVDGKMGPETLHAFATLAQDPGTHDQLMESLAYERLVWGATRPGPIDVARILHFQFTGSK